MTISKAKVKLKMKARRPSKRLIWSPPEGQKVISSIYGQMWPQAPNRKGRNQGEPLPLFWPPPFSFGCLLKRQSVSRRGRQIRKPIRGYLSFFQLLKMVPVSISLRHQGKLVGYSHRKLKTVKKTTCPIFNLVKSRLNVKP